MKQETSCYLPNNVWMSIPKWSNQTLSIIYKHYQMIWGGQINWIINRLQNQTEKIANEKRSALFKTFRPMLISIEQNTALLKYRQGPDVGEISIIKIYWKYKWKTFFEEWTVKSSNRQDYNLKMPKHRIGQFILYWSIQFSLTKF